MSFQITHSFKTHKISCVPNSSVGSLIELARAKFKIGKDVNVDLIYREKPLDPLLPLRFASLPNNAKLTLKINASQAAISEKEVTIRLTIQGKEGLLSYISKVLNSKTVDEFIKQVELAQSVTLIDESRFGRAQLRILNSKIDESEFGNNTIVSLVGTGSSVSGSLSYFRESDDLKRKLEQDRVLRLQVEQQIARDKAKRDKILENILGNEINNEKEDDNMEIDRPEEVKDEEKSVPEKALENIPETRVESTFTDKSKEEKEEEVTEVETQRETFAPIVEAPGTKIFLPTNSTSQIYDHSEDTYKMTLAQAEIYHKLIKNSMEPPKPKSTNEPPKIPIEYQVRIKFPDRSTLQLQLINETGAGIKFGILLKKLDEIVLPEFRNKYFLKFGFPPFNSIPFSFKNNDTFLHILKINKNANDIFTERTTLIWELEPGNNSRGPFIDSTANSEIRVTTNNERPEIQLESHRGDLPDDSTKKVETKKGVPKWLKLGK